jgi:hypothetical protein
MDMKPIALDINVSCASANKNYGAFVTQENILDVIENGDYIEKNRTSIVTNFLALALYDVQKMIFDDINRRLFDGSTPNSPN